jgi:hypothetical protein
VAAALPSSITIIPGAIILITVKSHFLTTIKLPSTSFPFFQRPLDVQFAPQVVFHPYRITLNLSLEISADACFYQTPGFVVWLRSDFLKPIALPKFRFDHYLRVTLKAGDSVLSLADIILKLTCSFNRLIFFSWPKDRKKGGRLLRD